MKEVKQADPRQPPLLTHVGWLLWECSTLWQQEFQRQMAEAGHAVFAEARAQLIPHIAREGTRQAELAARSGLSKQAIQQFVDALEKDGWVRRAPDPGDSRAKVVLFTEAGLKLLAKANTIKRALHRRYEQALGVPRLQELIDTLETIRASGLPSGSKPR